MEMPRNVLYYILIVAMLPVICECGEGDAEHTNYNISCQGNGYIRINTNKEIKFVASYCTNESKSFDVPDNKTVIVDQCPLNQNVSILMYNVSEGAVTLKPEAIVVMCNGTGLTVHTSLIHNAASFKPVTVTYQEKLTMKVIDKNDNSQRTTIIVGGSYTLQINSTDDLTIHVQSCNASSGGNGQEDVQLYVNGSSSEATGVFKGKFNETTSKTASIGMTGFRFVGKYTVVITCTVDVSTPPTTTVPTIPTKTPALTTSTTTTLDLPTSITASGQTQPIGRRKRRNAFQEEHTKNLAVSTSLRVESYYASTNGGKGMGGNEGRCMWIASILIVKYSLRWF